MDVSRVNRPLQHVQGAKPAESSACVTLFVRVQLSLTPGRGLFVGAVEDTIRAGFNREQVLRAPVRSIRPELMTFGDDQRSGYGIAEVVDDSRRKLGAKKERGVPKITTAYLAKRAAATALRLPVFTFALASASAKRKASSFVAGHSWYLAGDIAESKNMSNIAPWRD